MYFYVLPCTKARTNSRFKLNLSSFCFSLVICACENQPTDRPRATVKAWSNISSLLGLVLQNSRTHLGQAQNLQLRNEPRTASLPHVPLQMLKKIALKESVELVELRLDPLELPIAMKAWKTDIGLSCLGNMCPSSAHGGVEAGVSLHYDFPGDPSLQAAGMLSLAWAEHSPGQTS